MSEGQLVTTVIDGLSFSRGDNDGQARIRDIDAAKRAGWKRPRDIRKLIARLQKEGLLPWIYLRATVARMLGGQGAVREIIINEYWLTHGELMIVMARSSTEFGRALLTEMVRVFELARKGLLPTMPIGSDQLIVIAKGVAECLALHPATHVGRIGDSSMISQLVDGAIDAAAKATDSTWNRIHGHVRREFSLSGYRKGPICYEQKIRAYCNTLSINTPIGKLAKQLTLWPLGMEGR